MQLNLQKHVQEGGEHVDQGYSIEERGINSFLYTTVSLPNSFRPGWKKRRGCLSFSAVELKTVHGGVGTQQREKELNFPSTVDLFHIRVSWSYMFRLSYMFGNLLTDP